MYSHIRLPNTQHVPGTLVSNVMTPGGHVAAALLEVEARMRVYGPAVQANQETVAYSDSDGEDKSAWE